MANTELKTRIVLCTKTSSEWESDSTVILNGELAIESNTRKMKVGNGVGAYKELPYMNITPEEVQSLITASSHTHSNKSILDATTASFTTALLEKLNGIAAGANKTVIDSELSATSTNPVQNKVINTALSGKVPTSRTINGKALSTNITLSASDVSAIPSTSKGVASGVAELDSNGKVPASQLPSYVDDVIEGYYSDGKIYKDSGYTSELTCETGKIYVDLATNKTYRWSGSAAVEISASLALGETSSTAYRGDRGKIAYDHSQSAHAPSNAEQNIIIGIQKNGTDLTVDSSTRKVNVTVPTKTSELTNDSGYLTSSGTITKANQLTTARAIDGVNFNGTTNITHYATCSTVAATAAKTVELANFTLTTGSKITIKFTVTNTAASPTLNVNSTGAKAIMYRGTAISAGYLAANRVYEFTYDGTNWQLVGDINTDTNNKVTNTLNTTAKAYITGTTSATTNTGAQVFDTGVYLDTTAGTLTATTFKGELTGNVTGNVSGSSGSCTGNAATASKAAQLTTARKIELGTAVTSTPTSFNGTGDITIPVLTIDAGKLTQNTGDVLILNGNW